MKRSKSKKSNKIFKYFYDNLTFSKIKYYCYSFVNHIIIKEMKIFFFGNVKKYIDIFKNLTQNFY